MVGSARKITIEFLGKDSGLGRTTADVDGKTSKLGSTLKNVGKVAAVALAAGAVVAGKALFDMTKGAIEDEKAQALLARTLKNTTGASDAQVKQTEDWISAQGRALGVTDDELRPALQRMAEATGDVTKAQKLTAIAMDVSAGTGKSLKSVTEAMLRAQNGSVDGLSRYGIATKDAAGNTMSFDEVLQGMSKTFGGQAQEAANTLEGKMGRLRLIFDETKETIGAKLIPVVTKLADWFLKNGLPAIERFGGYLQNDLLPRLREMADWVGRNKDVLIPIAAVLGGVAAAVLTVVGVTKVWAAAQLVLNAVLTANPIGLIVVGIAALAAGLIVAYKRSETFREVVQGAFAGIKAVWDAVGPALIAGVKDAFKAIKNIIDGALDVVKGVFKVFKGVLTGDWDDLWDGVKQILKGAWKVIGGLVDVALAGLKTALRLAWQAIKNKASDLWGDVKNAISNKVDDIKNAVTNKVGDIKNKAREAWQDVRAKAGELWQAVKDTIGNKLDDIKNAVGNKVADVKERARQAWADVRSKAGEIWGNVRQTIGEKVDNIVDGVRAIPGRLKNLGSEFAGAGRDLIGKFVDGLKNAAGIISGIAGNVLSAVRAVINSGIDRVNSALSFRIKIPGPDISFTSRIPHLARGGIVRARQGGTLALLGEAGHDEAVVPLSGPHAPAGGFGGGTQEVILDLRLDGKTMQKVLLKLKRDNGGVELGIA